MSKPFDVQEFYQDMLARERKDVTLCEHRIWLIEKTRKLDEWELENLRLRIAEAKALIERLEVVIKKGEE